MLSILSSRSLKDESCSLEIFSGNNGERITGILTLCPSFLFLDNCIVSNSANSYKISVSQGSTASSTFRRKIVREKTAHLNRQHLKEWNHYPNYLQESTSDTVMVV